MASPLATRIDATLDEVTRPGPEGGPNARGVAIAVRATIAAHAVPADQGMVAAVEDALTAALAPRSETNAAGTAMLVRAALRGHQ